MRSLKERIEKMRERDDSFLFNEGYTVACIDILSVIDEMADEIRKADHYPEDVFLPLSKGDTAFAVSTLENACVSVDRYSAHLMRIAERNMKEFVLKLLIGKVEK